MPTTYCYYIVDATRIKISQQALMDTEYGKNL